MSLHRTTQDGVARAAAAVLCLAVAWIHVQDQGGFPGDKTPHYVAVGYYILEGAGALGAALLLAGWRSRLYPADWLLVTAVAAGPLLGYVLSRGPGLPNYSDDKGNWTEPWAWPASVSRAPCCSLPSLCWRCPTERHAPPNCDVRVPR